jgi:hypothetical protein
MKRSPLTLMAASALLAGGAIASMPAEAVGTLKVLRLGKDRRGWHHH